MYILEGYPINLHKVREIKADYKLFSFHHFSVTPAKPYRYKANHCISHPFHLARSVDKNKRNFARKTSREEREFNQKRE